MFNQQVTGLNPTTTYYFRSFATNSIGTTLGSEISFSTTVELFAPTVSTTPISGITFNSAISGGEISSPGSTPISSKGLVWSTSPGVTIENNSGITNNGEGPDNFNTTISVLLPLTTYYVRAYAINSIGIGYGEEISFTTLEEIITDPDGNVYQTVVIGHLEWFKTNLRSTKYADGSSIENNLKVYDFNLVAGIDSEEQMVDAYGRLYNYAAVENQAGLCPTGWRVSTLADWTYLESLLGPATGAGNKLKSCRQVGNPAGGDCNTEIHPRWNSSTQRGTDNFGFQAMPAGMYTTSFSQIGNQGWFWTNSENRVAKRLWNIVNSIFSQNSSAATNFYSVRCVRQAPVPQVFLPTVTTKDISNITANSAVGGGNVTYDGEGVITARGVVWGLSANPTLTDNLGYTTDGTGLGEFTSQITGLSPQTQYNVRAYATNSAGTSYGSNVSFTAGVSTGVTDVEGNFYPTIVIGNQEWMAKNLRTTTFNNGTPIPLLNDTDWSQVDYINNPAPSYGLYPHQSINGLNNDQQVKEAYGTLYNWFAATSTHGICPTGWRLPSKADVDSLLVFVSNGTYDPNNYQSTTTEGKKLKSCRQENSPLGGSCNTSTHPRWNAFSGIFGTDVNGFGALPAGYRTSSGTYSFVGTMTGFWTSEIELAVPPFGWSARALRMDQANDVVFREYWQPLLGYSIRCVRDVQK
ncbi:MAG: fibrobacter succinogenes major paralogous domain-containing protein [Bacteroidia bacterium]|nr:fibrobacter succinogenes major paralogous domain-containing protein [Bacteroidia bacterium]